jgi:hypothetical protein
MDMAVSYKNSYFISIFFNQGGGSLSAAVDYNLAR